MAQTGPSDPRLVKASHREDPDAPVFNYGGFDRGDDRRALLELSVAADGSISSVRRLETSGDPAFDKLASEYFSTSRLVPAIDAQGVPVAADVKIVVSNHGAYAPDPLRDRDSREMERIDRMRCKDFLWEYGLMRQILGDGSMARERLIDTSLRMFTDRNRIKSSAQFQLEKNLDITARASAVLCDQKPDEAYWQGVFVPMVQAQMRRLGLAKP